MSTAGLGDAWQALMLLEEAAPAMDWLASELQRIIFGPIISSEVPWQVGETGREAGFSQTGVLTVSEVGEPSSEVKEEGIIVSLGFVHGEWH